MEEKVGSVSTCGRELIRGWWWPIAFMVSFMIFTASVRNILDRPPYLKQELKVFNLDVTEYHLTVQLNKYLFLTRLLCSATGYCVVYRQLLQLLLLFSISTLVMETEDPNDTSETSVRKYHTTQQRQTPDNPPLQPQAS
jgi:hypothetical protein